MRLNIGKWAFFVSMASPKWSWAWGMWYNHGYQWAYDFGPFVISGHSALNGCKKTTYADDRTGDGENE